MTNDDIKEGFGIKINAVLFWHELHLILIFLQCLKEVKILECRHANAILQLREKWSNASIFSPNSFSVASAWAAGLEKKKKKVESEKRIPQGWQSAEKMIFFPYWQMTLAKRLNDF